MCIEYEVVEKLIFEDGDIDIRVVSYMTDETKAKKVKDEYLNSKEAKEDYLQEVKFYLDNFSKKVKRREVIAVSQV